RSNLFIYTKISSTLPFIEANIKLGVQPISILINGRKYVIPCQSYFSHKKRSEIAQKEYERISNIAKATIDSNQMSKTDERAKKAFQELQQTMKDLYSKPLPPKLYRRARREHRRMKRLQRLLHSRPDIIVRRIDKGEGFYFEVAQETTFSNSIGVARTLETYTEAGFLKSTTKFIATDVENLYTVIPRGGGIDVLVRFLEKYSKNNRIGPF
ncbi:unnamed protein product, partial [Rotaria socialis]